MRTRPSAELALLVTVLIWSGNFTAVKVGVTDIAPLAFSVVRFALGASVTVAVVLMREGRPRFQRRDLPLLLAAALIGITINQVAFVTALQATSAANVALLIGTIPIWTAVIAVLTRQERVARRLWLGLAAGLVGVTLIVVGGGEAVGGISVVGELGALATALSWAVYSVLIRPLMRRYSALQLSAFVMVVGTLVLVPFSAPSVLAQDWSAVPPDAWVGLLYAAILSVTVTNILYFTAIHRIGASRAALFAYLEPFLGVLIAVILLRDTVSVLQLAGGAVVLASVAVGRRGAGQPVIAEPGL
ncbi:MAG TPA: DMT family transporter [Candidatus Sulfotelmatobacter sp.]|nr:DMT family transporter [Candidatus Sulfotelmatobacter sp.]